MRPDWAEGRVRDEGEREGLALALFAVVWNAIAWSSLWAAWHGGAFRQKPLVALLIFLFPLVGLWLFARAASAALRRRRFGRSVLELRGPDGRTALAVGGALEATLVAGGALPASTPVRLELTVLQRTTTGSGKDRTTSESVLWQDHAEARGRAERRYDGARTVIPVAWRLPAGLPPASLVAAGADGVIWRLEATAELPGVDYVGRFALPVLEAEAPALEDAGGGEVSAAAPAAYRPPADSRVVVRREGAAVVADFPAARNRGAAASLTAFAALWTTVCVALGALGAPILFPIVFGLFDLFLLYAVATLWLRRTRARAAGAELEVRSGYLSLRGRRVLRAADVSAIEIARGMQSGSTAFFTISAVGPGGRPRIALGHDLRELREAEWVAAQIAGALSPAPPVRFRAQSATGGRQRRT